jgi:putative addiction module CopG family antidote
MNLQLPDDLNEFVQQQLSSGAYASAEQVVGDALRLLRDVQSRREEFLAAARVGIDQADRGLLKPVDLDGIIARGKVRLAQEGIID